MRALTANLTQQSNLRTLKRHLKSNLGNLNHINFAKVTTFNRNKDTDSYEGKSCVSLKIISLYTVFFFKSEMVKLICCDFSEIHSKSTSALRYKLPTFISLPAKGRHHVM